MLNYYVIKLILCSDDNFLDYFFNFFDKHCMRDMILKILREILFLNEYLLVLTMYNMNLFICLVYYWQKAYTLNKNSLSEKLRNMVSKLLKTVFKG